MTSKPKGQKPPIDDFNGYYQFLNNDYPTWVQYQGITFPNVTTAFQAARTSNNEIRKKISVIQNYEQFRELVSTIKNPQNWFSIRYKVMEKLIRDKFKRNKQISNKLASTQQRKLINCYTKGGQNQMYWGAIRQKNQNGAYDYKGTNSLGKILEIVRSDILKMQDTQKWVTFQNLEEDPDLYPQMSLTVLKQGKPIDKLIFEKRNYFLLGSHPKCQFKLQHPSISKFHAAIFFSELQVILVDTNSTHGTYIMRNKQNQKIKIQPLQKISLNNNDTIIFGLSSRSYVCNINLQKMQAMLKTKQQQIQKNVKNLSQVNTISAGMSSEEIKSKIGYKKYEAIYVQNINQNYSYNDIKELFKKYGPVEKIRLIQNYKNSKFQGQVVVIYENRAKIQDILKQIKSSDDKEMAKFQLKPVDKYDMQKVLQKNKQNRERQKERDRDRRSSRSRQKQRKEKHKKYDKYDRSDRSDRRQRRD